MGDVTSSRELLNFSEWRVSFKSSTSLYSSTWVWVSTLVAGLIFLKILFRWRRSRWPPGPAVLPILGCLLSLSPKQPMHRIFASLAEKYGPVIFFPMGSSKPTIIVSTTEMAKVILKDRDIIFASRPRSTAGVYLGYNYKSVVFAEYGDRHRQLRRFYQSVLLSQTHVTKSAKIREGELSKAVRLILEMHEPVNLTETIDEVGLNTMLGVTVGMEIGSERADELRHILYRAVELVGTPDLAELIPGLRLFGSSSVAKKMKAEQEIQLEFFRKIIQEKRLQGESGNGIEGGDGSRTLLQNLLSLEGYVIIPGSDTTVAATDWTMAEVLRHPHIMQRALEELDTVVGKDRVVLDSDIADLPFLQTVVKESLRLHPSPAMSLPHPSLEDCEVAGYQIPAKTVVFINLWAIGRDSRHWKNPLEFNPDRFAADSGIDVMGQHYEVLPFSSGRRGCVGKFLGIATVCLNVATLLQCFDWVAHDEIDMTEKISFACPRAKDLICSATPRLPSAVYENLFKKFNI